MKVSFDFDDTASRKDVQEYIRELKSKGIDVIITTSRLGHSSGKGSNFDRLWHRDLFQVADKLGISDIIFTGGERKTKALKGKGVRFHLDDNDTELEGMRYGVSVLDPDWKEKCNKLIQKK